MVVESEIRPARLVTHFIWFVITPECSAKLLLLCFRANQDNYLSSTSGLPQEIGSYDEKADEYPPAAR